MNLSDLKTQVEQACESAVEYGCLPDEVIVSVQIDGPSGATVYTDDVELHYDNDGQASG